MALLFFILAMGFMGGMPAGGNLGKAYSPETKSDWYPNNKNYWGSRASMPTYPDNRWRGGL